MNESETETQPDTPTRCEGTFVREGTMVAFPLCLPGGTVQIPPDESRITALDVADDDVLYGGTSGRKTHLIMGLFHGETGIVFDLGVVAGGESCAAVCCGATRVLAAVNGPSGGQIVAQRHSRVGSNFIQEWSMYRQPFETLSLPLGGERIVHLAADALLRVAVGVTEHHLFSTDFESGATTVIAEVEGKGRIALAPDNCFYGLDADDTVWRYDPSAEALERKALRLPGGCWKRQRLHWAKDHAAGIMYLGDDEGSLFRFRPDEDFSEPVGRMPLAPAGPMAVTCDGRVFGFCGEVMSELFCYNPKTGDLANLGKAVSVLERRRYGYEFADAVTGDDGQIYFAENDNLGHVWIYFPAIRR